MIERYCDCYNPITVDGKPFEPNQPYLRFNNMKSLSAHHNMIIASEAKRHHFGLAAPAKTPVNLSVVSPVTTAN